jgi:hypothetical protein
VGLDKSEGAVKGKDILCSAGAPLVVAREVEDQDSGTSRLNHFRRNIVPPTIDSAKNIGHEFSMRTSRRYGMRERPINIRGLVFTDQAHPRAALDAYDFWIRLLRAQHPVQSYRQLMRRRHSLVPTPSTPPRACAKDAQGWEPPLGCANDRAVSAIALNDFSYNLIKICRRLHCMAGA